MATFEYDALDSAGKQIRGVITAETAKEARQELRNRKLTPVHINNSGGRGTKTAGSQPVNSTTSRVTSFFKSTGHLNTKQRVLITRQLATLIETSVPLEEALSAIAQQSENDSAARLILSVRERVLEGWRFADALAEDEKSFPPLYCAVIAAGESSGDLGGVLERLAVMLEKHHAIRTKALTALIYPLTLMSVSLGVVIALMRFVVPKIVEQFSDFSAQLPWITRMVIAISEGLGSYGLYIIIALILGVAGIWRLLRIPSWRIHFDHACLKIPIVGKLLRAKEGARFGRTLATLFAGGAPLIDSLIGTQRTLGNHHIKTKMDTTISMVREGASLAQALKRADVLPPVMTHMIAAGEKSGQLPKLLDKSAAHLEDEFETATNISLRLIEPAIVVIMGLVVMVIVLSILLPTLQLNRLVSGG